VSWLTDKQAVSEQYADDANLRARQALWTETEGDDAKEILWRALGEWQPRRVLEVGGGKGALAERMQKELGAEVTFIDVSPGMVELAAARGVDARVGDAQELPFEDGSFDTVVAAWMLYHVADVDRALAEMARVLTPGGALITVTNSNRHIEELRELLAYERPGFDMTFSCENGDQLLRRHFADVARFDAVARATVRERDVLVGYRDSIDTPTAEVPEDVELPFVVHGRSTIFVATT
jgi:SAM-dependent methyltransferase